MSKKVSLTMQKASENDIQCAIELANFLESIEKGYIPVENEEELDQPFDKDEFNDLKKFYEEVIGIQRKSSLFRVIWGMYVLCDPSNKVLDTNVSHLAFHPSIEKGKSIKDKIEAVLDAEDKEKAFKSFYASIYSINESYVDGHCLEYFNCRIELFKKITFDIFRFLYQYEEEKNEKIQPTQSKSFNS